MSWPAAWWAVLWRAAAFVLLWGVLYAPLVLLVAGRSEQEVGEPSWAARLLLDSGGLAALLVATWMMLRWFDRGAQRGWAGLGLAPGSLARDAALGVAIAAGMVAVCLLVLRSGGWLQLVAAPEVSAVALAVAGLSMLLNAALQELLCRGYLFRLVERRATTSAAVVLTSLFFALLHAGAIQGSALAAVNLFTAGLLLAAGYLATRSLWLPIALHFAWNFLLGPVLGLSVSGQSLGVGHRLVEVDGPAVWTGGRFGIEASLGATLVTAAGIAVLYLLRARWRMNRD